MVRKKLHNIGIYKRICHCYNKIPFGDISAELTGYLEQSKDNHEIQAEILGVPSFLMPLSKPFSDDTIDLRSIDNWGKCYKALNLSINSPLAFVLETPMTIFHILNKYFFKDGNN